MTQVDDELTVAVPADQQFASQPNGSPRSSRKKRALRRRKQSEDVRASANVSEMLSKIDPTPDKTEEDSDVFSADPIQ